MWALSWRISGQWSRPGGYWVGSTVPNGKWKSKAWDVGCFSTMLIKLTFFCPPSIHIRFSPTNPVLHWGFSPLNTQAQEVCNWEGIVSIQPRWGMPLVNTPPVGTNQWALHRRLNYVVTFSIEASFLTSSPHVFASSPHSFDRPSMAPTPVEAKKAVSLWLTTVQLDLPKEDWNHLSRVSFRVTNLQIWLLLFTQFSL